LGGAVSVDVAIGYVDRLYVCVGPKDVEKHQEVLVANVVLA